MTDFDGQVLEWLATGERGISSETMAFRFLGRQRGGDFFGESHPNDPDDLRRCLLLLQAVPTARAHMDKLRTVSVTWARMVDRWDEMERLFLEECGGTLRPALGTECRKTYELMRHLRRDEFAQRDLKP